MKAVFEFIDYRKFLLHYYEERKRSTRYFSYRYFSKKVEINSPSFLKHVIDGKRNLTRPCIEKFCNALGLPPKEAVYFRHLVLFNQAKTAAEKQEHYATLRSLAGEIKESVIGADQYDYFANWYTPVIRELICLYNFNDDFKKIAVAVSPSILPSEASKAVRQLLKLKFVERISDGSYRETNTAITADGPVTSLAVRSFSQIMLDHSKAAIDTVPKQERHISGLTIGISPATYAVLAEEIEAFKDRVKAIVNRDNPSSRVYQMNMALFPVSVDVKTMDSKSRSAQ
jgi:uncharacterized protein (TIGR02147 family)